MTQSTTTSSTLLDSPWKEMLELYFKDFMSFFFPKIHAMIDWSQGYEFLDKELQQVVRDAEMGRRWADKLVKVRLKTGIEAFLYIHIEVQGQFEDDFEQRMYIYNYRLFDRYGQPILSLAVLGDKKEDWYPKRYTHEIAGCRVSFNFPIVKLWDYREKWSKLEKSRNPFSIVVRTHLKGLETQWAPKRRLRWKIDLYKALYEEKYSEKDIRELFRFLDWVLGLPEPLALEFKTFVNQYEEAQKMPYITSVERIGRQEAVLQNSRENLIDILQVRFKRVPKALTQTIQQIDETSFLSKLIKEAVLVDSLKTFKQQVENVAKS